VKVQFSPGLSHLDLAQVAPLATLLFSPASLILLIGFYRLSIQTVLALGN
jgi:hypothetical protein